MHANYSVTFLLLIYLASSNIQAAKAADFISTGDLQPDMLTLVSNVRGPVLPNTFSPEYSCLTTGEMVAMIAGSIVGGAVADLALGSGPFAVIGIAAGAALGSLLYRYSF